MINKIKEFYDILTEEIKYNNSLSSHKHGLEATLWGLEEQARFPEHSAQEDQTELNEKINLVRLQISHNNKLLDAHLAKVIEIIKEFRL